MTKLWIKKPEGFVPAQPQEICESAMQYAAKCCKRKGGALKSPDAVRTWLISHFAGEEREHFTVLYLDGQNRIIATERLFSGTVNVASVYPREVVKSALNHNAAAIICAHNHPSGDPSPSQADRSITRRIQDAVALVDINFLDHMVIGGDLIVSFAEKGWV